MRAKSILLLVLALGCGLIAAIGVTQVINQDSSPKETAETVDILVAKETISEGRKLTAQFIKVEAWPKNRVPDDAIRDIKEIEGMRARSEILVDDPIRQQKLLGKGDFRTPTDFIDPGKRAVPIKIERESNTGLIRPGDRVDVLANLRKNTQQGIEHSRTITLLQNVDVFAINDIFRPDPNSEGGETLTAKTVTLFLTPKQAEKVDLAQQLGKLRLIMRNPNDENIIDDPHGISTADLLGNSEEKPETKPTETVTIQPNLPPANKTWKVRILTGSEVDDVTLEERNGNDGKKVWQLLTQKDKSSSSGPQPAQNATAMPLGPIDSSLIPPGLEPSVE